MNHRIFYHLFNFSCILFLVLIVVSFALDAMWIFAVACIQMAVAAILFRKFHRCPHCGEFISIQYAREDTCPNCKEKF